MTNKEKYKKVSEKIRKLEKKQDKLYNLLREEDLPLKDKLNLVLNSDSSSTYIVDRAENGILDKLLEDYVRYETVDMDDVVSRIQEWYIIDTYEGNNEMLLFFDETPISLDDYNKLIEDRMSIITLEQFYNTINNIVDNGVSSFKFDW